MLRTTFARSSRRFLSTAPRMMAAGDTGGTRSGMGPGGGAAGDAFTKREKASEDLYFRQQEQAKLKVLREKLEQQGKYIDELKAHIDDLTKEASGGEHN